MPKCVMQSANSRELLSPFYRCSTQHTRSYIVSRVLLLLRVHKVFGNYTPSIILVFYLLIFQDENMVSFIKGGIKVRNSYLIYK